MRTSGLCAVLAAAAWAQEVEHLSMLVGSTPVHVGPDGSVYSVSEVGCSKIFPCVRWVVYRTSPNGEYLGLTDLGAVSAGRPALVRTAPDGRIYAAGTEPDGGIWIFESRTQRNVYPLDGPRGAPVDLAFDSGGNLLLLARGVDTRGSAFLLRPAGTTHQEIGRRSFPALSPAAVAAAADGAVYAALNRDGTPVVLRLDGTEVRAAFEPAGSALAWASSLAVSPSGSVYLAGSTMKNAHIATTDAAWQREPFGSTEFPLSTGFVLRLDAALTRVEAATLLGGEWSDGISAVALDTAGRVGVAGIAGSLHLPATGAFRTQCGPDRGSGRNRGLFLAKLDANLSSVESLSTLRGHTAASAPAFSPSGEIYWQTTEAIRWWPDRQPEASVACIVRSDYLPAWLVSERELITIFGTGFTDVAQDFSDLDELPQSAGGISVHFGTLGHDSAPAAILSVSPTQINVVLPRRDSLGDAELEVRRGDVRIHRQRVQVASFAPSALVRIEQGSLQPAASRELAATAVLADVLNEDGERNSRDNPARPGELTTVFVTGIGAVVPRVSERAKGLPAPARPRFPVYVETADGPITPEDVSTIAGRTAGVLQVRFRIPAGTPTGELGFGFEPVRDGVRSRPYFLYVQSRE